MPDSFQNPIGGGPKDPFEKFRVEPIEGDKKKRFLNEPQEEFEEPNRSAFAASISHLFKKFIDLFVRASEKSPTASTETDVKEHLVDLRAALEILMLEDRSQDAPFLNRLSDLWHRLLEDMLLFKRNSALSARLRSFVKEIQRYPAGHEHSLGYYLSEYAGQKWLPFPYMELIHRIYRDHQVEQEGSRLKQWVQSLDEMISLLETK